MQYIYNEHEFRVIVCMCEREILTYKLMDGCIVIMRAPVSELQVSKTGIESELNRNPRIPISVYVFSLYTLLYSLLFFFFSC